MEFLGLLTFCAVVDEGGVLAASRVLHTVQSNVTTRIKRLETEAGADLFFRKGRNLSLTPEGKVLLEYARQILHLEKQAKFAIKQSLDQGGEIRIGSMESFAAIRLPQVLLNLHEAYPSIDVKINANTSRELIHRVLMYELDCAFIAGPFAHPDLITRTVATEELVVVQSREGKRADTLIVFREGCAYRERALRWLRQHVSLFEVMEMGTLEGILGCVAFGLGVTLMPKAVVEQSQHKERLVCLPLDPDIATIPTLLIHHKESSMQSGMGVLGQVLESPAVA
ncbi:LysR family transcriptional regulator [Neptunomonas sp.]|uniref:LysR family transcriptional regulator n=1 Tax=Neptunomonas sp. TaxID=1971898 RepID=UPI0025FA56AB|nr:LysR family transcriptional regulator [Neptunomonas sp.]